MRVKKIFLCRVCLSGWFLLFCLLPGWLCAAQRWTAQVRFVVDGDTFVLRSGQKIRLKSVDAPELAHDQRPEQYYARQAQDVLRSLVQGKTVLLEPGTMQGDRFGRIVSYVWLADGRLLNQVMLAKGACFCFPHGRYRDAYWPKLLAAQRQAMDRKLGFWPRILVLPASRRHYIGNKKTLRFHSLTCRYGQRISRRNRRDFWGLWEAFYAGYAPCRSCTPWPLSEP